MKSTIRRFMRSRAIQAVVRACVVHSPSRHMLNTLYCWLPPYYKQLFTGYYGKIFSERPPNNVAGSRWIVQFNGKEIVLPLRSGCYSLDWEQALSAIGREPYVIETYAALLNSCHPPELFLDIGANYGLHSLLFLIHGIETISFEPNPKCHDYFREVCAANSVNCTIQSIALSNRVGQAKLWFPMEELWIGSMEALRIDELEKAGYQLESCDVETKMVDDYIHPEESRNLLLKIDVEGHEHRVLEGAARTLEKQRPIVIFECFSEERKRQIFDFLRAARYLISMLPYNPNQSTAYLGLEQFIESRAPDFIALPIEAAS